MRKILVIGDIHGRDSRKKIVEQDFDKVIFLGDYFDSFDISIEDQIKNYEEIMHFKSFNRDKVICLLGNHDFMYLPGVEERYSGYSEITKMQIGESLEKLIRMGYIQLVYTEGDYLFSHAGISKTWLGHKKLEELNKGLINSTINIGKLSKEPYGNDKTEGPLRIRPEALHEDLIDGYKQVHGHTQKIELHLDEPTINVDTLEELYYLEINDGVPIVRNI